MSELPSGYGSAFDTDLQVIHAAELDDLHYVDDLMPLRLLKRANEVPKHTRPEGPERQPLPSVATNPAATGATTSRLLIAAKATGATTATVATATVFSGEAHANVVFLAANESQ